MYNHRRSFTHMLNPHYQMIAEGYGINYDVVTNREELKAKVEKMVKTDDLTYLSVLLRKMRM